jgi:iron complex transport system substrate-binding protein
MSVFHFRAGRKWAVLLAGACAALDACGARAPHARPSGRDDFGDSIVAGPRPARIISLSPATTEILFALGAGDRLVGRTHWDTHPDSARRIPDLGNGIRPNIEALLAARPDLVVLYATDDNRDAARALHANGTSVIALRIDRVADFVRATTVLGLLTDESARARTVVDSVTATLARVRAATGGLPHPRVFLVANEQPLMALGAGSFVSELVDIAGGQNAFGDIAAPSPQVSFEEVLHRDPDVVMAAPSLASVIRTDPRWRGLAAVRAGRVLDTDTTLVALPGVRLGEAAVSIARMLHPGFALAR